MFNPIGSLISLITGLLELLLSLRFLGKFFGIAPTSEFVNWIYTYSQPIVSPFAGIIPNFSFANFFIETATVISLLVIGFIGYLLGSLFFTPRTVDY